MKRLTLLAFAALSLSSCSKTNSTAVDPKPNTSTILLTKIIENTIGNASFGKPVIEFTYNGKQLTKAVMYSYTITPNNQTHLFIYDGNGNLTGTTITQTGVNNNGVIKSTVATSGSNITSFKVYKAGDVLYAEHTLTYSGSDLTKWFDPSRVEVTYGYDSSGNNTSQNEVEYSGGKPDGFTNLTTNKSFDDKNNLTKAIPYWIYFRAYLKESYIGFTPGRHNPVSVNSGSEQVNSYTYNSYGYPATMTTTRSRSTESYAYEYMEVK